jgi:hypothetical protein
MNAIAMNQERSARLTHSAGRTRDERSLDRPEREGFSVLEIIRKVLASNPPQMPSIGPLIGIHYGPVDAARNGFLPFP